MKFYDKVIFSKPEEIRPGVWGPDMTVAKPYPGTMIRMISKWDRNNDKVNEDKRVNNQLEIIADEFLDLNWMHIRSIMWKGAEWAVNTVTYTPPHLTLEIGELYNGTGQETP